MAENIAGSGLSQTIKRPARSGNTVATETEQAHEPITRDTVMAGRLRDAGHANYGKLGGATIWQHTTIPRLSAVDQPLDRTEAKKVGACRIRGWLVDGAACASLEEAIEQLNVPPVVAAEGAEVLVRRPDACFQPPLFREQARDELGRQAGITILMLRQKGDIENELRSPEPSCEPWIRRKLSAALATQEVVRE